MSARVPSRLYVVTLSILPVLSVLVLAHRGQSEAPAASGGSGLIVGRVIEATTKEPIDGALAQLRRSDGAVVAQVWTTPNGSFVFRDLPAGAFTIGAVKVGFESTGFSGRPVPIALTGGQKRADAVVLLRKYASIVGTVTDDSGEPVVNVTVRAVRMDDFGRWNVGATAVTDDRGMYRFGSITPGRFLVMVPSTVASAPDAASADLAQPATNGALKSEIAAAGLGGIASGGGFALVDGQLIGGPKVALAPRKQRGSLEVFPTAYYPDAIDPAAARVITIASGREQTADIRIAARRAFTVAGDLRGDDGAPLPHAAVRLAQDSTVTFTNGVSAASTITDASGHFVFPAVASGRYRVTYLHRPPPAAGADSSAVRVGGAGGSISFSGTAPQIAANAAGGALYASADIDVAERPIGDLALVAHRGATVSGRVVFVDEGTPPGAAEIARATLNFLGADGRQDAYVSAHPDGSGAFVASGLLPVAYTITAAVPTASGGLGWKMRSATLDGRDVGDVPLEMTERDSSGLVVTLTRHLPTVAGVVRNADNHAVTRGVVVIFPADRKLWTAWRRLKSAVASPDGRYSLPDVIPGEYLVAAVSDDLNTQWRDQDTLTSLAKIAQRVTVDEGRDASQDVRIANGLPPGSGAPSMIGSSLEDSADTNPPDGQRPQARDGDGKSGTLAAGAAISGVLTDSLNPKRPVRAATITLNTSTRGTLVTYTDEVGRFAFDGLDAGSYRVAASKPAYLTTEFGASRPLRPGVSIALAQGEHKSVSLSIARGAVIAGVVRDAAGKPLAGALVKVVTVSTHGSFVSLETAAGAMPDQQNTDDRGAYRFYNLAPGDYVVGVARGAGTPLAGVPLSDADVEQAMREVPTGSGVVSVTSRPLAGHEPGKPQVYGTLFYPGVDRLAQAQHVVVAAGEVRDDIDIQSRLVTAATVSGAVLSDDGSPAKAVRMVMAPRGAYLPTSDTLSAGAGQVWGYGGLVTIGNLGPNGTFSIGSVTPGDYLIIARGVAPGSNAFTTWAMANVTIDGADVSGLALTLRPGLTVAGSLSADPAEAPDTSKVRVGLDAANEDDLAVSVPPVPIDASGHFRFTGILPGRYRLAVSGLPAGWIAASASLDARESLDRVLELAPSGAPQVRIVLSHTAADISGAFLDVQDRATSDYHVIVFDKDQQTWVPHSTRVMAGRPDTAGRFAIGNLPAGHYWLAAVTDAGPNEWDDAAFLASLVPSAIAIELAAGEHKVQNIKLAGK